MQWKLEGSWGSVWTGFCLSLLLSLPAELLWTQGFSPENFPQQRTPSFLWFMINSCLLMWRKCLRLRKAIACPLRTVKTPSSRLSTTIPICLFSSRTPPSILSGTTSLVSDFQEKEPATGALQWAQERQSLASPRAELWPTRKGRVNQGHCLLASESNHFQVLLGVCPIIRVAVFSK